MATKNKSDHSCFILLKIMDSKLQDINLSIILLIQRQYLQPAIYLFILRCWKLWKLLLGNGILKEKEVFHYIFSIYKIKIRTYFLYNIKIEDKKEDYRCCILTMLFSINYMQLSHIINIIISYY
jgi:hypothetical protein